MSGAPTRAAYKVQMLELVSYDYEVEAATREEAEELVQEMHCDEGGAGRCAEVVFWQVCAREVQP